MIMNGSELRQMRMEMGWRQAYMAEALGVSRSSLAHWEQWRAPVPGIVSRRMKVAHRRMMKMVEEMDVGGAFG